MRRTRRAALLLLASLGAMPVLAQHERAQRAARSIPRGVPVGATLTLAPDGPPFAASLQIAAPGPQPETNGLSYRFTLTWSARAGAGVYRVFAWTDAARTWYRLSQTTSTSADAHAFKSGCTAFMVIAFADTHAPDASMTGLEASNVVRFPLSQQPNLCPAQHP